MSESLYELRISGQLSERVRRALGGYDDLTIVAAPPETILYATVIDDAHLQGILALLSDLGLRVVSMSPTPDAPT